MSGDTARVRVWVGDDNNTLQETICVEYDTVHVWQDSPRYHSPPIAFDVHPDDGGELEIYTSDSINSPPGYDSHVEHGYWNGPIENGLRFEHGHDAPPFGCEVWGRVMFFVRND